MRSRIGLALAVGLFLVPSVASAQMRGARNAPAMTADGPVINPTQTPEWRQSGGNYDVWQQIMMQKMAAQQQAAFQKQQAEFQKWAKANPAAYQAMLAQQQAAAGANNAPMYRRKKKHVLKGSTADASKAAASMAIGKPGDAAKKEVEAAVDAPAAKVGTPAGSTPAKPNLPK